jgi:putative phosphoribosyl transferase
VVRNDDVLGGLRIDEADLARVIESESEEVRRREAAYRGDRPPVADAVAGRQVVLVDDGLATGATMRAGVLAVRAMAPRSIVVAVPVGASSTCDALREVADAVVCVHSPADFRAVGWWYDDFSQTSDDEVRDLLAAR